MKPQASHSEATFPVSCLVVKRGGGMVVFCAGTSGSNITFDARYAWMRQKRVQGSHFAHLKQASAANRFVIDRRIDPCMSDVFPWAKITLASCSVLWTARRWSAFNFSVLIVHCSGHPISLYKGKHLLVREPPVNR